MGLLNFKLISILQEHCIFYIYALYMLTFL